MNFIVLKSSRGGIGPCYLSHGSLAQFAPETIAVGIPVATFETIEDAQKAINKTCRISEVWRTIAMDSHARQFSIVPLAKSE